MPNTLAIQIADAIVAEINAHEWAEAPGPIEAKRQYLIVYKGEELKTIKLSAAPITQADENITRAKNRTDFIIKLDIQKRLSTPAPYTEEIDELVNFLAELKAFYSDGHRLASPLEAFWIEDAVLGHGTGELWDVDGVYYGHSYEALIELTVRGVH